MSKESDARPDRATILRYIGLQLPGFTFVSLLGAAAVEWLDVAAIWAIGAIALWVAKDAAMFPFVWRAYANRTDGGLHDIRGRFGRAEEDLAPEGRVQVGSEHWRAVAAGGTPIPADSRVRVIDVHGLRITVERADEPPVPAGVTPDP